MSEQALSSAPEEDNVYELIEVIDPSEIFELTSDLRVDGSGNDADLLDGLSNDLSNYSKPQDFDAQNSGDTNNSDDTPTQEKDIDKLNQLIDDLDDELDQDYAQQDGEFGFSMPTSPQEDKSSILDDLDDLDDLDNLANELGVDSEESETLDSPAAFEEGEDSSLDELTAAIAKKRQEFNAAYENDSDNQEDSSQKIDIIPDFPEIDEENLDDLLASLDNISSPKNTANDQSFSEQVDDLDSMLDDEMSFKDLEQLAYPTPAPTPTLEQKSAKDLLSDLDSLFESEVEGLDALEEADGLSQEHLELIEDITDIEDDNEDSNSVPEELDKEEETSANTGSSLGAPVPIFAPDQSEIFDKMIEIDENIDSNFNPLFDEEEDEEKEFTLESKIDLDSDPRRKKQENEAQLANDNTEIEEEISDLLEELDTNEDFSNTNEAILTEDFDGEFETAQSVEKESEEDIVTESLSALEPEKAADFSELTDEFDIENISEEASSTANDYFDLETSDENSNFDLDDFDALLDAELGAGTPIPEENATTTDESGEIELGQGALDFAAIDPSTLDPEALDEEFMELQNEFELSDESCANEEQDTENFEESIEDFENSEIFASTEQFETENVLDDNVSTDDFDDMDDMDIIDEIEEKIAKKPGKFSELLKLFMPISKAATEIAQASQANSTTLSNSYSNIENSNTQAQFNLLFSEFRLLSAELNDLKRKQNLLNNEESNSLESSASMLSAEPSFEEIENNISKLRNKLLDLESGLTNMRDDFQLQSPEMIIQTDGEERLAVEHFINETTTQLGDYALKIANFDNSLTELENANAQMDTLMTQVRTKIEKNTAKIELLASRLDNIEHSLENMDSIVASTTARIIREEIIALLEEDGMESTARQTSIEPDNFDDNDDTNHSLAANSHTIAQSIANTNALSQDDEQMLLDFANEDNQDVLPDFESTADEGNEDFFSQNLQSEAITMETEQAQEVTEFDPFDNAVSFEHASDSIPELAEFATETLPSDSMFEATAEPAESAQPNVDSFESMLLDALNDDPNTDLVHASESDFNSENTATSANFDISNNISPSATSEEIVFDLPESFGEESENANDPFDALLEPANATNELIDFASLALAEDENLIDFAKADVSEENLIDFASPANLQEDNDNLIDFAKPESFEEHTDLIDFATPEEAQAEQTPVPEESLVEKALKADPNLREIPPITEKDELLQGILYNLKDYKK